jgi:hypothetical protein
MGPCGFDGSDRPPHEDHRFFAQKTGTFSCFATHLPEVPQMFQLLLTGCVGNPAKCKFFEHEQQKFLDIFKRPSIEVFTIQPGMLRVLGKFEHMHR